MNTAVHIEAMSATQRISLAYTLQQISEGARQADKVNEEDTGIPC